MKAIKDRDYCTRLRHSKHCFVCAVSSTLIEETVQALSISTTFHTFRYKYIFSGQSFNFLKSDSSWKEFAGMSGTEEAEINDLFISFSLCLLSHKDGCNSDEIPFTLEGSLQRYFETYNQENI